MSEVQVIPLQFRQHLLKNQFEMEKLLKSKQANEKAKEVSISSLK